MALSTSSSAVTYQGNGAATSFAVPFMLLVAEDLQLTVTDTTVSPAQTIVPAPSAYTVTGIGGPSISVAYPLAGPPLGPGQRLTIERQVPYTQPLVLPNQGGFYPAVIERAFDHLAMQIQQLLTMALRTVGSSAADSPIGPLPLAADRAGKYLAFNAAGDPLVSPASAGSAVVSAYMASLLDDVNAAAALQTLGISAYMASLLDDVNAAAALQTLGISAYMASLLDDVNAPAARATLGIVEGDPWARDALLDLWLTVQIGSSVVIGEMADGWHDAFLTDTIGASSSGAFYDSAGKYYSCSTAASSTFTEAGLLNHTVSFSGYGFRNVIATSRLSAAGTQVRVKFVSSTSLNMAVSAAAIGIKAAGGNAWDFAGGQVALTFNGGAAGFSIAAGQSLWSDWVTLTIDRSKDIVVAFAMSTGSYTISYKSATGAVGYAKSGGSTDATTTAPGGYSSFPEIISVSDIEVRSNAAASLRPPAAATARLQPSDGRLEVLWRDLSGSATLNTDLIAEISRDGGSTWTAATLTNRGAYDATWRTLTGTCALTSQPAGTALLWRLRTTAGKEQRVRGVAMMWG